jgi:hypothetical protein
MTLTDKRVNCVPLIKEVKSFNSVSIKFDFFFS